MEWHWLALIDEIGGIPLDLTTGALLTGNPITIGIEVQQIGAGLDLRNSIVSHRGSPSIRSIAYYIVPGVQCQEKNGRGLISGCMARYTMVLLDLVHGHWNAKNMLNVSKSH